MSAFRCRCPGRNNEIRQMRKRILVFAIAIMMIAMTFMLSGCGNEKKEAPLDNGTYVVTFLSDHSMFHVNDANNDKGILTVKDGEMTVHVSLQSKKIVKLFYGNKEDAQKEGADLIEPSVDLIDYGDGYTSEVYGFDVPVPYLDEPFEVSILGTHDNWYTHNVTVSDPVLGDDIHQGTELDLENGDYTVEVALEGGSGKASVESPTTLKVENGEATLTLIWSSANYDYMIVDGAELKPVNEEGNSTFEVPVKVLNEPFKVIADTTAMSQPHEIEYELTVTVLE